MSIEVGEKPGVLCPNVQEKEVGQIEGREKWCQMLLIGQVR